MRESDDCGMLLLVLLGGFRLVFPEEEGKVSVCFALHLFEEVAFSEHTGLRNWEVGEKIQKYVRVFFNKRENIIV